ncbi:MAG: thiolase family protein [Desulfobacterales bacterium]|jgi:acetyl-CoA acyltransferase|nr:thiolase family protein [Desulfobacteraceae bacterium]MBT4365355.1 thiolase family protein [Desulfobacteraceae bacterium]MBT7084737.1 thiolase family protein [Desulfobacterales bacterium]MBT7696016.1 thiolase family protein [Desulfobacterales bacterium]
MRKVKIIGCGMTKFGRHMDRNLKSLVKEAVTDALNDADITKEHLNGAWVGNVGQGCLEGQYAIRGQAVLRNMGIGGIPIINVENACSSSAFALNGAWAQVALGEMDVALVVGMEKMYFADRSKVLPVFTGCMDVEEVKLFLENFAKQKAEHEKTQTSEATSTQKSGTPTIFMDVYASAAMMHMEKYGTTQRQFAAVASKNHYHSTMNPKAQYQDSYTIDEVLASPVVSGPMTRLMCSPIGDGAAAVIICSEDFAKKNGVSKSVELSACCVASGQERKEGEEPTMTKLAKKAYERAGIGPEDVDLAEVHDATALGEIVAIEDLLLCPVGEGGPFTEAGHTTLGGKIPVNVSGGLECQGHPIGATGARQVVELYMHLTGAAGERQVEGAKIGIAENAGGTVSNTEAALAVTILKA